MFSEGNGFILPYGFSKSKGGQEEKTTNVLLQQLSDFLLPRFQLFWCLQATPGTWCPLIVCKLDPILYERVCLLGVIGFERPWWCISSTARRCWHFLCKKICLSILWHQDYTQNLKKLKLPVKIQFKLNLLLFLQKRKPQQKEAPCMFFFKTKILTERTLCK